MSEKDLEIKKLLGELSKLGIKFEIDGVDTVYIKGLDGKTIILLDALLSSKPDEFSQETKGYRLWWD